MGMDLFANNQVLKDYRMKTGPSLNYNKPQGEKEKGGKETNKKI